MGFLRTQLLLQWTSCFVIGLITGILASGIITGQHEIIHFKFKWANDLLDEGKTGSAFLLYTGIGLACTLGASLLTSLLEPLSGGSGIPDVKSYLNGLSPLTPYPATLSAATQVTFILGCFGFAPWSAEWLDSHSPRPLGSTLAKKVPWSTSARSWQAV